MKDNFYKHEIVFIIILIFLLFANIIIITKPKIVEVEIEDEIPKIWDTKINKPNKKNLITKKNAIPSIVSDKTIYLTFDDGPSYLTDQILDILEKENVPATFFVIGAHFDEYQNTIKRAYDKGHKIAIHSLTHKYDYVYTDEKNYFNDLNQINNKIYSVTGHHSHIVRLPGGSSNNISKKYNQGIVTRITDTLIKNDYYYFDWNIDSKDAAGKLDQNQIFNNATAPLHSGTNIILMHDAGTKKTTVEALPYIIKYAKANGYTFAKITKETPPIRHKIHN